MRLDASTFLGFGCSPLPQPLATVRISAKQQHTVGSLHFMEPFPEAWPS